MFNRITFVLFLYIFVNVPFSECSEPLSILSGKVTGPEEIPLPGASVTLLNRTGSVVARIETLENGSFHFENIRPGEYVLQAVAGGFATESRKVLLHRQDQSEIVISLSPFGNDETLTVTASKMYELEETPGGTDVVSEKEIQNSLAHNMKDVLYLTPGVIAQPRFGADEAQFSIRGSGLRNNFHMRGLNILVNGIPYQDADGFSDFESIDLLATQHIEVWKGAEALRYGGNSMGGAINFVTNTGEGESLLKLRGNGGSYGLFKGQISSGGVRGPFDYYLSFSNTAMDGYREHSAQSRNRLFGNFGWILNDRTHVGVDVVYANVSEEIPGSLTREEFHQDPSQADQNNVINDWGREYDYTRLSARAIHQIDETQDLEVILFGQYRNMEHPIFLILDQDARNFGIEMRYRINATLFGRANRLIAGFSPTSGSNNENRYINQSGEAGALAARFQARARNLGFYFENQTDITKSITLSAAGRIDISKREFEDRLLTDGDRSDERTYSAFSPKIGVLWKMDSDSEIFGNISRSYEPPLLLELTSFGAPGFLDLQAQDTWQFELGSRGQLSERAGWDVSIYDAEINNELININALPFPGAPFTIPSYRNSPNTRHFGLEIGSDIQLTKGLFARLDRLMLHSAYTYSRFRFVKDNEFGSNQIPGAPTHLLRTELRFENSDRFWIAPNLDWSPSTYFVDSANTVKNDKYVVLNLKAGVHWQDFNIFFEASNLTDELYSGSVQVDNALGRYFEPSNRRSFHAGIQWEL